jgi:RelA/SpoT family (p)ppGpp synthetase
MKTQPTSSNSSRKRAGSTPPPDPGATPKANVLAADAHHFGIADLCALLNTYLPAADVADVERAYRFGAEAHDGQCRVSGEPYITHPLEVAHLLASLRLDARSLCAALMHDVVEDTGTDLDDVRNGFGPEVAELVDGVSKITRMEFQSQEEAQAENFRKMLLAMAADIRVILIKLADRLHNLRTIAALPLERRRALARETLDIYAPIANRLGVRRWGLELENLGFAALYPLRHRVLTDALRKRHGNRKALVEKIRTAMMGQLEQEAMPGDVQGREKNLYSIYKKMQQKHLSFEEVHDVYGFRVQVDKADTCYRALGVIHNLYKPIPGRFKDYIAIPKANGYQSLHTTVFGPFGVSIEIQIRTADMHRVAEAGVASHWLYKSGDTTDHMHQRALQWLKELLDTQQKAGNPHEFLEHLKVDLFPDEVYVFTPNGAIKKLPRGATVVDFAYDVHTDLGNHCISAKINDELAPLRTILKNGDRVEIVTAKWAFPNPAWLDYVVTGKARANIRQFLKNQKFDEAMRLGKRLLEQALDALDVNPETITEAQCNTLAASLKLPNWNQLLNDIGLGNRLAAVVARQLVPNPPAKEAGSSLTRRFRALLKSEKDKTQALAIRGTEGIVVTYGRCCHPIPGDAVVGYLSAGKGIVIHTDDCPNLKKYREHPEQWIDVQWEREIENIFPVALRVEVKNQRGVLASVAAVISEQEANIDAVNSDDRDGQLMTMDFTVEVRNRVHLATIMRRLRGLESVVRVTRRKG